MIASRECPLYCFRCYLKGSKHAPKYDQPDQYILRDFSCNLLHFPTLLLLTFPRYSSFLSRSAYSDYSRIELVLYPVSHLDRLVYATINNKQLHPCTIYNNNLVSVNHTLLNTYQNQLLSTLELAKSR